MEPFILRLLDVLLKGFGVEEHPQTFIAMMGLIMARLVPAINYTPFFGGGVVLGRTKIALSFALAFLLYPAMISAVPISQIPTSFLPFFLLLVKEAIIGFTIGYVTSVVFYGIQAAGQMVDNMRGASMAQLFAVEFSTQVTLLGKLKLQAAITLFFLLDCHLMYIRGLFYSFERLPVNAYPSIGSAMAIGNQLSPIIEDLIRISSDVLLVSLQLAGPVLVCLFLSDVIFGIFNRVAPQVNVYFLSLPVKMMVGLGMLFLLWAAIVEQMEERFIVYLKELYTLVAKATPFGQ
ncbi:MAG: flagellar biosynthetic protein FliR [Acidobacteriota bacterium]|nr:flagellar biosynthetic protein FliR [Blastocatellia bacterium]MDW8411874.1 flagellar biosynthetic protein FliR [Acidobacteriota bacterium]